jgi:NAD(P)-dependent dehydrogenase (short-subunit alcohol dehydrogenase family)
MRLAGKVAIVTGAARGIGLACARRFALEGGSVMLSDIDPAGGDAARDICASGATAAFHQADVSRHDQVSGLVDAAVRAFGRIDILVSNVGVTSSAQFIDVREDDFDRVLRVNLKSAFLCGQAVAGQMIAQGEGGAVVNISSMAAELAMPTEIAYGASKGAIRQLTKAMALSLAPHGIRVNAVGPGSIETDLTRSMWKEDPELRRSMLSRTPIGRLGRPEEIASVALFLASEESSYVTGQTIYADGGRLALNFVVPVPEEAPA